MSISGAFNNALSGLTVAARAAELVSSNVANASTDGYGVRTLELTTRSIGGYGAQVHVVGVNRQTDNFLLSERRSAEASVGQYGTQEQFFSGLEQMIGTPDQAGSLSGLMAQFEVSLINAASHPESEAHLSGVLYAAESLVSHINGISDHIQTSRTDANNAIAGQVSTLNTGLKNVESLNAKIQSGSAVGADVSTLMDQRQIIIDELSSIVPMNQIPRENGKVALVTTGGAIVLDGTASQFEFTSVNMIVPEMTLDSGALSGLTLDGRAISTGGNHSLIAGGSLEGNFQVRDELSITAQARIDGVARDLIDRFQDASLDSTRSPGDPGLFTDAGAAFDAADELAVSSRISINAAVDPNQSGAVWRLRDGLGATSQGNVGDASLLNQMADAFSASRIPMSSALSGAANSSAGLAAEFLSLTSTDTLEAKSQLGFATAQYQSFRQMELAKGVDTDAELQKLMLIEQSYAANARVISVADEMIQTIISI